VLSIIVFPTSVPNFPAPNITTSKRNELPFLQPACRFLLVSPRAFKFLSFFPRFEISRMDPQNRLCDPAAKTTEAIPTKLSPLSSFWPRMMRVKYLSRAPTPSSTSFVKVTLFSVKNDNIKRVMSCSPNRSTDFHYFFRISNALLGDDARPFKLLFGRTGL